MLGLKESLTKLKNLKRFSVGFYEINPKGIRGLTEALDNLVNLEFFCLQLATCLKTSDDAFKLLASSLKKLPCLKSVIFIKSGSQPDWATKRKLWKFHHDLGELNCELRLTGNFLNRGFYYHQG